jgi:hypothetical protein
MFSVFSFGKLVKYSVLAGLVVGVISLAKSDLHKFGELFADGDATSLASTKEVAQSLGALRQLIANQGDGTYSDLQGDGSDDESDQNVVPGTGDLAQLLGDGSIYSRDGAAPKEADFSGGIRPIIEKIRELLVKYLPNGNQDQDDQGDQGDDD